MKRLIIIDISSFIFRAFYAIRPLTSPEGTPVNSVYGVYTMVLKLILDYKPTHLLIAGDRKGPTFRHKLYEGYKANRTEPPEDLVPQFELIEKLVSKMGIKRVSQVGYEADDIIGSMVANFKNDFDKIFITTGDKDLMQFVGGNVFVLDTKLDKVYRRDDVKEKMGVYPFQIVDYLSMVGDSSDNIPGMKGIGAKGAAKLLEEYETLENIYKNKSELKNKRVKEAFEHHYETGLLSKKLVEIITNLEMDFSVDDIKYQLNLSNELKQFLEDLGFKSQLKKFEELKKSILKEKKDKKEGGSHQEDEDVDIILVEEEKEKSLGDKKEEFLFSRSRVDIDSYNQLKKLFLGGDKGFFFYRLLIGENFSLSFCLENVDEVFYLSNEDLAKKLFLEILNTDKWTIVGHSLKKDFLSFWDWVGQKISFNYFDLSLIHYLVDSVNKHDLKKLSEIYLDQFIEGDFETAVLIKELFPLLHQELKDKDLEKVYSDLDNPLIPILGKMEKCGILLDSKILKETGEKLSKEMREIEEEIENINGGAINLRSPKQVSEFLFGKLQFPVIEKTKTMQSTNVEVLEELDSQGLGPVPKLLLRYREIDKLFSTYVNVLPEIASLETGRVHASFHQDVAATGRLSSDRPNLQNIPIRSEDGRGVRKAFIAKEGHLFMGADYSQVELRILAHFSEDPIMIKSFHSNLDIHAQTASEVLEKDLKEVTNSDRNLAKTVNFGLMYGQSSFGLARTLRIKRGEAKKFIDSYFHKFGRVKGFLDGLKEDCAKNGYAKTLHGRKRYIPGIHSKNYTVRANAERMSINTPVQGTAADIIKVAMININKILEEKGLKSELILQVHDELIFEVPMDEQEAMQKIIKDGMENAVQLKVPLRVEVKTGGDWYQLK